MTKKNEDNKIITAKFSKLSGAQEILEELQQESENIEDIYCLVIKKGDSQASFYGHYDVLKTNFALSILQFQLMVGKFFEDE